MSVRIIQGDCRAVLAGLEAESVHCVVTSPPYWGLRDYGIPPTVWGGDTACSHQFDCEEIATEVGRGNWAQGINGRGELQPGGVEAKREPIRATAKRGFCRCGAWRGAHGLEPTIDLYVRNAVEVFRAVHRVLRPDGTLWLNLGDSFSSGVSDASDLLNVALKRSVLFYGGADPRGRSAERINVLLYDKAAPNDVFEPLFASQRISIKNGQDDLCEIGGFFDPPILCLASVSCLRRRFPQDANAKSLVDLPENIGIIVTAGDLHTDATLRQAAALTIKNCKAPFAIKITGEPIAEGIPGDVPVWDAITLNSGPKGAPQVDAMDQSVALLDRPKFLARGGDNFRIRKASDEQLTLALHRGCQISFLRVAHLFASINGLTPYRSELDKAQRQANASRAKQELGIPDLVKRALMEDGWICRQTIIWAKPNPMPESITDRCTKAHEYLFLLSKSARYYYDAEAIKEPLGEATLQRGYTAAYMDGIETGKSLAAPTEVRANANWRVNPYVPVGRNKRSVWTVATSPYPEAHFATFPPELIEPCIKAGTSERGCCGKCGALWERQTARVDTGQRQKMADGWDTGDGGHGTIHRDGREKGETDVAVMATVTLGWYPVCACDGVVMLPPYPKKPTDKARLPEWREACRRVDGWIRQLCDDVHGVPTVPAIVLDPFGGAGTTGLVSDRLQRDAVLVELSTTYAAMASRRIHDDAPLFAVAEAAE